jgi:hypothetical protein
MKAALATLLSVLSFPALGCFAPPAEQITAPDELIQRTENIVLAGVIEAKSPLGTYEVTYTFQTVRALKGDVPGEFQITGYPAMWEGSNRNFDHHNDEAFWSSGLGRSPNDTDCVIHPTFAVGGTYLVFLGQPYHAKSFEAIIRTHGDSEKRDKWLQYVEARTGPN